MLLSARHRKILTDLLSLPTAPFTEGHVKQYVIDFCRRRSGLTLREDRAGNLLVHYKRAARKRPVCLCGHLDHPGFRAGRMLGPKRLRARWLGGVPAEYFPGTGVRFFSGDRWIKGRVDTVHLKTLGLERPQVAVDAVEIELRGPQNVSVERDAPGMWDLPEPRIRNDRVYARGCDDVAGVAAILAALDNLTRSKARTEAYCLFTRAEEVGFIGAIAACRARTIPRRCLVVAIETSSVLPGVTMGGGPILRVGDRSSIFTPELTAWCRRVADKLATRHRDFTYQRKLMDGGSCESSAYCQLGYDATGLCVALGNYHNCDRRRQRIAPEYVDVNDLANLIRWFGALWTTPADIVKGDEQLRKRLGQLERRYRKLLEDTSEATRGI